MVQINDSVMNVRGMDPETQRRLKAAASARGLTIARYLDRLLALHQESAALAAGGDKKVEQMLLSLGLESVTL